MRHHGIVGAGQTRDRVEQDHDVALMLGHASSFFDHPFPQPERGGLPARRKVDEITSAFTVRAMSVTSSGSFVDQQYDEHDFRMILGDRIRDILENHGLCRPWEAT